MTVVVDSGVPILVQFNLVRIRLLSMVKGPQNNIGESLLW